MVANRAFHHFCRAFGGKPVLRLSDELRLADEDGDQRHPACCQVFPGNLRGLAVAHQFPIGANPFEDGCPESCLVRAALRCRNGIAVALDEPVSGRRPVDRPFDLAWLPELFVESDLTRKRLLCIGRVSVQAFGQKVRKAARKAKRGFRGDAICIKRAFPADLDAAEEIGLGAGHPEEARRRKLERAEYLVIGVKGDRGAAPVRGGAHVLDTRERNATRELLHIDLPVPCDLDAKLVG